MSPSPESAGVIDSSERRRRMDALRLRWPRGSSRTQPLVVLIRSAQTHSRSRGIPPRYVLDSVPVSYESTFRF